MLIDSHVHLDDPRYDQDRDQVFQRAHEAGIEAFVTIGCDLSTSQSAANLAEAHDNVFATIGVHPHESKEIVNGWYDEFRKLAQQPKIVAYGEIGLDYHYDHSPRDVQRQRFREQVQLAKELHLPIVIHTREAQEDTITILKEEGAADVGGGCSTVSLVMLGWRKMRWTLDFISASRGSLPLRMLRCCAKSSKLFP